MVEPTSSTAPVRRQAVLLTKWQRFSASLVGIGASGGGGLAVFTTDNQAGSTALLLLGGLGLLMAISGRVPDRIGKEGVNYDPVDPATTAVETMLYDDAVPLDTREIVAEAVRSELDRRRPTTHAQVSLTSYATDRLSQQADAILFEVRVRDLVRAALPDGAQFAAEVRHGGRELDGVVSPLGIDGVSIVESVVIEATAARSVLNKMRSDLQKMAHIRPGGLVYVARADQSKETRRRLQTAFSSEVASLGLRNAHLVLADGQGDDWMSELGSALKRAWSGLR